MRRVAPLLSFLIACALLREALSSDLAHWPLWPDPSKVAQIRLEPAPLSSVGRDAVARIYFKYPSSDLQRAWGAYLKAWVVDGEDLRPVSVYYDYGSGDLGLAYITGVEVKDLSINQTLKEDLRLCAVHPEYKCPYFTVSDIDYPNQDFFDSWLSSWWSFLVGDTEKEGKALADSGHAPPLLVWKKNPWLTRYVDSLSYPPSWGEDPWLFLPANDGLVHAFEINPFAATAVRRWSLMPLPAFQLAVYQEHLRRTEGHYPRVTLLDGPCEVYDVENAGREWRRVLIGTTGAGSALMNKAKDAWKIEYGNSSAVPNDGAPLLDSGRHFGVYAIDVTDPDLPNALWNKCNIYWSRGDGSDVNPPDLDITYAVARPLIGFTKVEKTRHWHAIILGVDTQGGYRWYDFDPITGAEKGKGVFGGSEGGSEFVDLIDEIPSELYYPSRVLAAFPPNGTSPVLSDVYAYLSNGSLYYWNIQKGEPPKKLLKIYDKNAGNGLPLIGDFDITYMRESGGLHTYLAAALARNLPRSNLHEPFTLLVVDLSAVGDFRNSPIASQELEVEEQDEDTLIIFKGKEPRYISLVGEGGLFKIDRLVLTPTFVGGKLYLAAYSSQSRTSRLYMLGTELFKERVLEPKKDLKEGIDYLDFQGEVFEAVVFGSDGKLYVATEEGKTYTFDKPAKMRALYWRVKN